MFDTSFVRAFAVLDGGEYPQDREALFRGHWNLFQANRVESRGIEIEHVEVSGDRAFGLVSGLARPQNRVTLESTPREVT